VFWLGTFSLFEMPWDSFWRNNRFGSCDISVSDWDRLGANPDVTVDHRWLFTSAALSGIKQHPETDDRFFVRDGITIFHGNRDGIFYEVKI
jgi:hypothetical protein